VQLINVLSSIKILILLRGCATHRDTMSASWDATNINMNHTHHNREGSSRNKPMAIISTNYYEQISGVIYNYKKMFKRFNTLCWVTLRLITNEICSFFVSAIPLVALRVCVCVWSGHKPGGLCLLREIAQLYMCYLLPLSFMSHLNNWHS